MTVTPTTAPLATIIAHLAAWRASNEGDAVELVCDTEDALIATRDELAALVGQWRVNAAIREDQPPNKRDASSAVIYRICADELDALLTHGPIPSELENGEAVTHD